MYDMPMHPTLLRTSQPSPVEALQGRLSEIAREMTARELADVLQVSPSTVTKRRRGLGWTVSAVCKAAAFLNMNPSDVFADLDSESAK